MKLFCLITLACGLLSTAWSSGVGSPATKNFSACLLVKDDNQWLAEWIAYHYHTLPLRHLVVAIDPSSVTSPKSILDRFNSTLSGLDVELWKDRDYFDKKDLVLTIEKRREAIRNQDNGTLELLHLYRQTTFVGKCMSHHKRHGRSWVALVDTDEFIVLNDRYDKRNSRNGSYEKNRRRTAHKTALHVLEEKKAIIENPCIGMVRTLFGPRRHKHDQVDLSRGPSSSTEYEKLRTLKFFYHDSIGEKSENGYLKVIVDVKAVSYKALHPSNIFSIHRPIKGICPDLDSFSVDADSQSIFRVHHYLGSLQDYNARCDVRRSREKFDQKARAASRYGPDFNMRPWLKDFIREVGAITAKEVLAIGSEQDSMLHSRCDQTSSHAPCALLFFGLPRKLSVVYPSIQEKILRKNPECKIFVHTFNASSSLEGSRFLPNEREQRSLDELLTRAVSHKTENEDSFQKERDVKYYRKFFPFGPGWTFPTSMDNMIHQWHSIEGAWKLLEAYELKNGVKFSNVGLFRIDVLFEDEIRIMPEDPRDPSAVIPSLMHTYKLTYSQYNDRMFYGDREYAEIWATDRFSSVEEYIDWQKQAPYAVAKGLHSETFMHYLLREKWALPIEEKDVCFKRIRRTAELKEDCELFGRQSNGVVVLGMHRSGTSLLTGLLDKSTSLLLPGRRVAGNEQNAFGFFENRDVVRQNDIWLQDQGLSWDNPYGYDGSKVCFSNATCAVKNRGTAYYSHLEEATHAYSRGFEYSPWLLKDPRLCIMLKEWLYLTQMKRETRIAVLFTYRNPLEVAQSLQRRETNQVARIADGLQLWIHYNRMAILNSQNMCRIITSNDAIMEDPIKEINRIHHQIRACGLNSPPFVDHEEILRFIRKDHMHAKSGNSLRVECTIPAYKSNAPTQSERETEFLVYSQAMKVFCDIKSGAAFEPTYEWPSLLRGPLDKEVIGTTHESTRALDNSNDSSKRLYPRRLQSFVPTVAPSNGRIRRMQSLEPTVALRFQSFEPTVAPGSLRRLQSLEPTSFGSEGSLGRFKSLAPTSEQPTWYPEEEEEGQPTSDPEEQDEGLEPTSDPAEQPSPEPTSFPDDQMEPASYPDEQEPTTNPGVRRRSKQVV